MRVGRPGGFLGESQDPGLVKLQRTAKEKNHNVHPYVRIWFGEINSIKEKTEAFKLSNN